MVYRNVIRDIGATAVNTSMGLLLEVARRLTNSGQLTHRVDPVEMGIHVITPIEPSERSGGGKAVKELLNLFSTRFKTLLIVLPSIVDSVAEIGKKPAELMISGIPALKTSAQFLFGKSVIEKLLVPGIPVLLEFSECATFLLFRKRLNCFTILREHEVLLRRYDWSGCKPKGFMKKVREASARYLCRSFLRNIYEKIDIIVTLTKEDSLYIQNKFPSLVTKIVTIPVVFEPPKRGGDIGSAATGRVKNSDARALLFLGNLYHWPNLEALKWFLRECVPHLDRGFTLHLCGMDGPINNIRLPEAHITIIRHGYVEDIESEIGWVRIGVSPVFSGGGTRIKNLYLGGTGRVVVTTPLGNEGIGYRDGEEAIIRSDGYSMATELNALAKDTEKIRRLGWNAAKKVKEDFNPEKIWQLYVNEVFNLCPKYADG